MARSLRAAAAMLALVVALDPALPLTLGAQAPTIDASPREPVDQDVVWRIRREATDRSELMRTLQVLTDLHGPRLTGSPGLRRAQEWILERSKAWRLENAHLEPWSFGHDGWINERVAVHLVAPVKDTLVVEVLAWTPGTPGAVLAQTTQIGPPPSRPTQADLDAYFERWRGQLRGRAVLVGPPARVDVANDTPARRRNDDEMRARFSSDGAAVSPPAPRPATTPATVPAGPTRLTPDQAAEQLNLFLVKEGAALRINDAGRTHGQIRAFNNRTFDVTKAVPTIVLRNEDYGRIARLMSIGEAVSLEATVVNQTYPEGRTQYNLIAEIPGSDKADEVVMLGGHLDSWHAATGATDNAVGVAVMLEAARVLRAIGAAPRRTIRVALWSGEEQGLRGSAAYVAEHFGTHENPKPEYERFAGYFNLDSGTGRARGMTVFGPPEAARILRATLKPFDTDGVMGATTTRSRTRGGSDHTSFNAIGLPGISVGQDPIEYDSHTWHTNLDTFERIVESDARQATIAIAAAVYHLAMRDERLPRFTKDEMPANPADRPRPATTP
ncbi:MAG: M20/M25/M40 family metallo-hydrolase [Vicinamibacterales bacterium]